MNKSITIVLNVHYFLYKNVFNLFIVNIGKLVQVIVYNNNNHA